MRASSTGVTVAIAVHENFGRTNSSPGSAKVEGNAPSCPVTAATRNPARNAGRTGGSRVPRKRWLSRYARTAHPTMIGTFAAPSDVLRDEKMLMTNGITAPAIRPCTMGAGIHAAS